PPPPPIVAEAPVPRRRGSQEEVPTQGVRRAEPPAKRWPIVAIAVLGLAGAAAGVYFAVFHEDNKQPGKIALKGTEKGSAVVANGSDTVVAKGSDTVVAKGSDAVGAKGSDTVVAKGSDTVVAKGS